MNKEELIKKKIVLIQGQIIRMDYAKERIDALIEYHTGPQANRLVMVDWMSQLKLYKHQIENHLLIIKRHLLDINTIQTKDINRAKEETESLIFQNITKQEYDSIIQNNFEILTKKHKVKP